MITVDDIMSVNSAVLASIEIPDEDLQTVLCETMEYFDDHNFTAEEDQGPIMSLLNFCRNDRAAFERIIICLLLRRADDRLSGAPDNDPLALCKTCSAILIDPNHDKIHDAFIAGRCSVCTAVLNSPEHDAIHSRVIAGAIEDDPSEDFEEAVIHAYEAEQQEAAIENIATGVVHDATEALEELSAVLLKAEELAEAITKTHEIEGTSFLDLEANIQTAVMDCQTLIDVLNGEEN